MEDLRKVIGRTTTGSNAEKPLNESVQIRTVRLNVVAEFQFPASAKFNESEAKKQVRDFLEEAQEKGDSIDILVSCISNMPDDVSDDPEWSSLIHDGEAYFYMYLK